jgi:predicted dehydrogenase
MCGWAGSRHYTGYGAAGIPVTHFVDAGPDADATAARLGVARLPSIEALAAAPVDIVSIALPPGLQPQACRTLLAAGKAVLCEKPMAATGAESAALAAAVDGARLMPAFLMRFHPVYRRMKALIESGQYGRLHEVAIDSRVLKTGVAGWRLDAAAGGAMLVNGIHAVDLAHWFCGPELAVECVRREKRFFDAAVNDCVRAWLSTPGGTQVSLRAQWWPFEEFDVDSEWSDGWTLRVRVELDNAILTQAFNGLRILERGHRGQFEVSHQPNLFAEEIRHFADAVRNGTPPAMSIADNTRAQSTVDAILAAPR